MPTISFITANYVARALNYPGGAVSDWGKFDKATRAAASAEHFQAVCRDVADAGFEAIDVWSAHCHFQDHGAAGGTASAAGDDYLEQVKGICSAFDFTITSYAGGLSGGPMADFEPAFRFVKQLGAPLLAGGMWGADPAAMAGPIDELCGRLGVRWALENHPEKTADEILAKVGGGRYANVGVALDTGWCGTHGMDALDAVKRLRETGKLFIVHLKDVAAAGGHETCALGEGVVPVEGVVRYLVESGWEGDLGIEHEPFDRDPMPEVRRSLERVRAWLK